MIYNILIDSDNNYIQQTCTMLYSLKKHLGDNSLNIFFAQYTTSQLAYKNIVFLKKALPNNCDIHFINIDPMCLNIDFGRWNKQIILRLYAILYLPDFINQIIRIDGDVIIDSNVDELFNQNLENYTLKGTLEYLEWTNATIKRLRIKDNIYLNSGVLIINVDKYKEKIKTYDVITSFLEKNHKNLRALDQDFLNVYFDGSKTFFSNDKYMRFCAKYHDIPSFYKSKSPSVFHYAGFSKPWSQKGFVNYRLKYWKYGLFCFDTKFLIELFIKRSIWIVLFPIRKFYFYLRKIKIYFEAL